MSIITSRIAPATALAAAMMLVATGCVAGEGSQTTPDEPSGAWSSNTLTIDFATYNPLSLVIRDQGILEQIVGDDVTVEWVQSAGSNKANELLRSGSVDVGSTAGSAALLARANGSPIKVIDIYSQPEWAAIVVPEGSEITSLEDLAGTSVAATKSTDPYFFLLQALEEAGLSVDDIEVQNLQHADGWSALNGGSVDVWSGLDPIMADAEVTAGATLIYRNVDFNTYGFLNATEDFIENHPDLAQAVVDAYEQARVWALEHPAETAALLAEVAGIDLEVAELVITERSNLDVSGIPGDAQVTVLEKIVPVIAADGDVLGGLDSLEKALATIIHADFAEKAVNG